MAFSVLLVDDNPDDRLLVGRLLAQEFEDVAITEADSAETFRARVEGEPVDLVITDYQIRGTTGLDVLHEVKARWPDTPVIMYTGTGNEEIAVQGLKQGLDDYLVKSVRPSAGLPFAVRAALTRKAQREEERKRILADAALLDSEQRYRLVFDNHPHPMWVYSTETLKFLAVNDAALAKYGYSRDEFLAMSLQDIRPPEDVPAFLERLARERSGESSQPVRARHRTKSGDIIVVNEQGYPVRFAQQPARLVMIDDVTMQARAEQALRDSEARLRAVFDGVDDAIIVFAESGHIEELNRAAERMFGYTAAELIGQHAAMLLPSPQREEHEDYLRRYLATGNPRILGIVRELQGRRKDGGSFPIELLLNEVLAEGPRVFIAIVRDMTERHRLEGELRQLQKMEAVGRLAGGVAHDFNNLLTAILGYSELMLAQLRPDDPMRQDVEEIRNSAERAAALTRQLLAFSRKQVLQPVVLDVNSVVRSMEKMLRRLIGEDIELDVRLGEDVGRVRADQGQLEQVIVNLAVNARDAMPRGGRLSIETFPVLAGITERLLMPSAPVGRYAAIRVSDTGVGMSPEVLSRVFEPFFTTKEHGKGTGLGLSTVYGIVKQSGGDVKVESAPGKGATFTILLPQLSPEEKRQEGRERTAAAARGIETVLLVEDEEAVRSLAAEALKRQGYTVLEAPNGLRALEFIEKYPGPIHLVVTDVVMPEMNGRDLAGHLAVRRPDTRVLFTSGYTDDLVLSHGVSAATPFLHKPFTPSTLAKMVREVLDQP